MSEFYEKVEDAFKLAMRVNIETKHDVFVEYAPHIKSLSIRIYIDGYSDKKDALYLTSVGGCSTVYDLNAAIARVNDYL